LGSRITRVMGFHPANFEHTPVRSRLRSRHGTDRRTDRHRPSFYNAAFPTP